MKANVVEDSMRNMRGQGGFTIIELLISIAVIAILATITVISYNGVTRSTQISVLQGDLSQTRGRIEVYKSNNGSYPSSLNLIEEVASDGTSYVYTYNSVANTYCLEGVNQANEAWHVDNTRSSPVQGAC